MGGLIQRVKGALGLGQGAGGKGNSGYLQYTQDKWNDLKNAYVVYHQSIWQALLFYANQSWIDWDDARKVWQPQQPTDEWIPRPRINRFGPTMDSVGSNFFQLPPIDVQPKKEKQSDPEAYAISDICSDLVDYAIDKEGLEHQANEEEDKAGLAAQCFVLSGQVFSILRIRNKPLGQAQKQGMGAAYSYQCDTCDKTVTAPATDAGPPKFCPNCGQPVEPTNTETLQPQTDPLGNPIMEQQSEPEIELDIDLPLFAFPRAGAVSLKDSPWFLWAKRRTLDDIYFRFDKFEAQEDAVWPDGYSVTYEHALNFWYTGYSNTTLQVKDSCMVLECWVAPNKVKDHPEGFYNVSINDKDAHSEPWDFPCHPVTTAKYLTFPTLFFGRAISFDVVEIQREDNAYESIKKLHGMVSAVDPWVIDVDTVVNEITGRADKVIKYRKTSPNAEPPHRAGHGSLDEGIYKQGEILQQEYRNISGATAAFKGEAEYAGEPAAAAKLRRDQAELQFGKPSANWRNFWRETMRKYILFMQKYYSLEQLARILGEERIEDIRAFKGADLGNMVDFLASSSGMPQTKMELKEELGELFAAGALDVNDPSVKQRVYEVYGETGMMEMFNENATNARLENQAFKNGVGDPNMPGVYIPPQIQPLVGIEDLEVHIYFHKKQILARDFQKWPPEAQQALIEHFMQTQMALEAQMAAMQPQGPQDQVGAGDKPAPQPPQQQPAPGAPMQ